MKKFSPIMFYFCALICVSSLNAYSQVEPLKTDTIVLSPKYFIKNEVSSEQLQLIPATDRGLPDWLPIVSDNVIKIESHSGDKASNFTKDRNCKLVVVLYVSEKFYNDLPNSLKPYYSKEM